MSTGDVNVLLKKFEDGFNDFVKRLDINDHRYRSWEQCYKAFSKVKSKHKDNEKLSPSEIYELCLELGFYLSSWGMLRGSSFLIWRDCNVHAGIIKELFKMEYDDLWHLGYDEISKYCDLIIELYKNIAKEYREIRKKVYEEDNKRNGTTNPPTTAISQILISKILMGTLGCVPAYDTYFTKGIKGGKYNIPETASDKFCKESLFDLAEFYRCNSPFLEGLRKKVNEARPVEYPQMKILDMGFWEVGMYIDENEKADKQKTEYNSDTE